MFYLEVSFIGHILFSFTELNYVIARALNKCDTNFQFALQLWVVRIEIFPRGVSLGKRCFYSTGLRTSRELSKTMTL